MTTFHPTPEQADAIEAPLTPQLLVAGAGAGKTTVMAHRILHVVQSGQARADQVLALTFTNKAAQHLKQRVREVLGPDADATIATYHSFGASLVADHALELDLAPGTRVLNRAESWQLLFAVFDEFRFDRRSTLSPEFVLTDALNLASRAADHLVPVEAIVADCHEVQAANRWKKMSDTAASRLELCQVVAAYERRKRARDLLDFDDQVGLAVRLLTDHPDVADDLRLAPPRRAARRVPGHQLRPAPAAPARLPAGLGHHRGGRRHAVDLRLPRRPPGQHPQLPASTSRPSPPGRCRPRSGSGPRSAGWPTASRARSSTACRRR